jgi:hypothetical protein
MVIPKSCLPIWPRGWPGIRQRTGPVVVEKSFLMNVTKPWLPGMTGLTAVTALPDVNKWNHAIEGSYIIELQNLVSLQFPEILEKNTIYIHYKIKPYELCPF